MRQAQVAQLLNEIGHGRGYQSRIAKRLGVHRGTVSRDMARLGRVRFGGREADDRHRAEKRRKQRNRAEDKWLRELIEADGTWTWEQIENQLLGIAPELPAAKEPRLAAVAEEPERLTSPPNAAAPDRPPQTPRWLPPSRCKRRSRTFPESRPRR